MRQGEGGRKGGKEEKKERKRKEGGREKERQEGGRGRQRRGGWGREGQDRGMILGCEVFPPHSYEEMPQREHALAHGAL